MFWRPPPPRNPPARGAVGASSFFACRRWISAKGPPARKRESSRAAHFLAGFDGGFSLWLRAPGCDASASPRASYPGPVTCREERSSPCPLMKLGRVSISVDRLIN